MVRKVYKISYAMHIHDMVSLLESSLQGSRKLETTATHGAYNWPRD